MWLLLLSRLVFFCFVFLSCITNDWKEKHRLLLQVCSKSCKSCQLYYSNKISIFAQRKTLKCKLNFIRFLERSGIIFKISKIKNNSIILGRSLDFTKTWPCVELFIYFSINCWKFQFFVFSYELLWIFLAYEVTRKYSNKTKKTQ